MFGIPRRYLNIASLTVPPPARGRVKDMCLVSAVANRLPSPLSVKQSPEASKPQQHKMLRPYECGML